MFDKGNANQNYILHKGIGLFWYPQHFSDGAFHGKSNVDENLPMTKYTDLTSIASAPNLIKSIKVYVIYRASNSYFMQASSTLYLGTVTICYPTTEKNHPVGML